MQKNRHFGRFFWQSWSEWGDSNSRHLAPKPMSEPSGSPVASSLVLSSTPAVPLWNSFALFVSDTAFVFWDLCGMEFCILKVLPTGFTPASDDSVAENASEIAPHKQWNKPRLGSCFEDVKPDSCQVISNWQEWQERPHAASPGTVILLKKFRSFQ